MLRASLQIAFLAITIVGLTACVDTRTVLPETALAKAAVDGFEDSLIRLWGDAKSSEIDLAKIKASPQLKSTKDAADGTMRQDFLVLSGGGANGAYGAGFLSGWTKSGQRPDFSMVTGVSTGAIIAPFAYLGSEYNALLEEFYTTYSTKDLVRSRGLGGILAGSSAADSKPLANLIAKYITPEIVKKIADEYSEGRFLLIGTTNLDEQRPVIWNMGEIARKGNQRAIELFRKIILASISIPAAFPPVLINVSTASASGQELHVDGGTTDNAILVPFHVRLNAVDTKPKKGFKRRVFVIVNSRSVPKREVVKTSTIKIAVRSISTLIQQQTSGDVLRIYNYARANSIEFNYREIPKDFDKEATELFDPIYMQALFDLGKEEGTENHNWKSVPNNF
ncbi:MAG: patatin-like phospholipase family protein [Pseudomonadota bacterium]